MDDTTIIRSLSNFKTLRFTIDDKETGISSYHATIDRKWALFEYEPKKKELTFNFDKYFTLEGTKHSLEISVIDNVGNETIHQLEFFRKWKIYSLLFYASSYMGIRLPNKQLCVALLQMGTFEGIWTI